MTLLLDIGTGAMSAPDPLYLTPQRTTEVSIEVVKDGDPILASDLTSVSLLVYDTAGLPVHSVPCHAADGKWLASIDARPLEGFRALELTMRALWEGLWTGRSDTVNAAIGPEDPGCTPLVFKSLSALTSHPTAGLPVGRISLVPHAGQLGAWELQAGNDAENSPEVLRPADYAASTNEKIWVRVL